MPPAAATLTFAIGDVHGCLAKLRRLLEYCRAYAAGRAMGLVFVGDYIDRGPHSRGVVDLLMRMQAEQPDGVVCLSGNHEAAVLSAVAEGGEAEEWWIGPAMGGSATLASYGVDRTADLPFEHQRWFDRLALCYDDGLRYFVHAGVRPGVALAEQQEEDQVWIREEFLSCGDPFDRFIVHGHTPLRTGMPDLRANRVNLDTAAVYGGPLTAAVFDGTRAEPLAFLNDLGDVTRCHSGSREAAIRNP